MGSDMIIAALIVAAAVIGALFWMQKIIRGSSGDELREELNAKRDLAAQVPLLNQRIATLADERAMLQQTADALKTELAQKNVTIAEHEKDRVSFAKTITGLEGDLSVLRRENEALGSAGAAAEEQKRQLQSALENKTHEMQQAALAAHKDIERLSATLSDRQQELSAFKNELAEAKTHLEALREQNTEIRAERSRLQAGLSAQKESNLQLKKEFEEQSKKLELKLNEIMQNNLDNKLKKFDETSMKSLDGLLKPFKENLETFKKKVEDSQENSTKKFAELSKEIEQVTKAGMNISREAESLAKALKGKKQTQGSWGEMILESVLEYSGLLKGVHYDTQESYRDEEGKTKRPDVVIKLPQGRTIIIDSKVSLNDYDRYIRAETEEERLLAAKGIAAAFKNHIDTLDAKDYAHYKVGTLQYVFMFVPIEGAFAMAVQQDPGLYEYALKKHIAIVNPSTLTVSLRTIYLYWQSEQSSTLASKLFDEAGKLYDKMTGFAESFRKIGSQLQTVSATYDTAHKQLTEGTGNLMGRVENLKRLGARTSKTLKSSKMEFQDFNDAEMEVEVIEVPERQTPDFGPET